MKLKSSHWKITALALIAAILAGCTGQQPSLEPTVDTQPTFAMVQTQAVQTAVADMTLNAPPTATQALPTETPLPAATLEPTATNPPPTVAPIIPTSAPTSTVRVVTNTPAYTATSSAYNCTITEQSPSFGYDIRKGSDFDGRWVVKNTGSETWTTSDVDIRYVSGEKFQTNVDALDLSSNVAKNDSFTIIVDMLAPNNTGRYSATWAVYDGGQTICVLPITIDVTE